MTDNLSSWLCQQCWNQDIYWILEDGTTREIANLASWFLKQTLEAIEKNPLIIKGSKLEDALLDTYQRKIARPVPSPPTQNPTAAGDLDELIGGSEDFFNLPGRENYPEAELDLDQELNACNPPNKDTVHWEDIEGLKTKSQNWATYKLAYESIWKSERTK